MQTIPTKPYLNCEKKYTNLSRGMVFFVFFSLIDRKRKWGHAPNSVEADVSKHVVEDDLGDVGEDPIDELGVGGRGQVREDGALLRAHLGLRDVPAHDEVGRRPEDDLLRVQRRR